MAVEALSGVASTYPPPAAPATTVDAVQAKPAHPGDSTVRKHEELAQKSAAAQAGVTGAKPQQEDIQAKLKEATRALNDFMSHYSIKLQFKIEDNQTIVRVVNQETGELIRQIPSEETLRMSKALDTLQGLIIQKKV